MLAVHLRGMETFALVSKCGQEFGLSDAEANCVGAYPDCFLIGTLVGPPR